MLEKASREALLWPGIMVLAIIVPLEVVHGGRINETGSVPLYSGAELLRPLRQCQKPRGTRGFETNTP